jgi:predicted metalloprotease with PDZ domain
MNTELDNTAVVYTVRPKPTGAHVFEVTCRIDEPNPEGQVFSMPAWIPGSYLIRDYARHVVHVEAESNGHAIPLRKTDKSTWWVGPADGPVFIRAEIYAHDLSVRGAFLDQGHGFFNGVCLFFRIHGLDDQPCLVHVDPPPDIPELGWQVATGLERLTGEAFEFGAFVADSYEALIDHPFLIGDLTIGRFSVAGAEHIVAIAGRGEIDLARLEHDFEKVCAAHVEMYGGAAPFSRYVFLVMALNKGYGGLEHHNSSALICDRKNLPRADQPQVSPGYRDFLGLVSHEYFHLWNVKRIRPAEFVPGALDKEIYTRQLWVFEGITSYYDDLGLLRCGLIEPESYLELLGRTLTAVYRTPGRRRQTLEESSFDAWIKFYRPDENSPNAVVSYYSKGAMVALALDLELRLKSGGRCSLDDIMRALWQKYGVDGVRGLGEGGFENIAEEVSGLNLADFFKQTLRTTVDPPVGISLAQFGIVLHMRATESASDRGGQPARRENPPGGWLGFGTRSHGDRVRVKHVYEGGPAALSGLSSDDEIVALNRNRIVSRELNASLERLESGQSVEIDVFRRDELIRVTVVAAAAPRDTCYLGMDPDADDAAVSRRREWLGG